MLSRLQNPQNSKLWFSTGLAGSRFKVGCWSVPIYHTGPSMSKNPLPACTLFWPTLWGKAGSYRGTAKASSQGCVLGVSWYVGAHRPSIPAHRWVSRQYWGLGQQRHCLWRPATKGTSLYGQLFVKLKDDSTFMLGWIFQKGASIPHSHQALEE